MGQVVTLADVCNEQLDDPMKQGVQVVLRGYLRRLLLEEGVRLENSKDALADFAGYKKILSRLLRVVVRAARGG